jgi:hypothetical protein
MPLRAGLRGVARPGTTLLPALVLLLPLLGVAAGVRAVMDAGADAALTGLVAGAPRGATDAVLLRPDAHGVRLLVALAALLVLGAALLVAAGLVAGAATAGASGAGDALRRALRAWPRTALVTVALALAAGAVAAGVIALAVLAGRVRFELTTVVLVLGLGALAVVLVRLSLWPALAAERGASPAAATAAAWRATRGSVIRLVLAAAIVVVALALPTWVLGRLIGLVLGALSDAEVLGLSPVAIGLWSLLFVPVALLVGTVVWGAGARAAALAVDGRE